MCNRNHNDNFFTCVLAMILVFILGVFVGFAGGHDEGYKEKCPEIQKILDEIKR